MSQIIKAILDTYTHTTELYVTNNNLDRFAKSDGWQIVDTLRYHAERKLKREIQDLEFWIPRQADQEANAKLWMQRYRASNVYDEISGNKAESSVAKYEAEKFSLTVMHAELAAAKAAYKELTGTNYTTISDKPDAEIPDNVKSTFARMDALLADNDEPKAKKKA